jgi:hypothetical protein
MRSRSELPPSSVSRRPPHRIPSYFDTIRTNLSTSRRRRGKTKPRNNRISQDSIPARDVHKSARVCWPGVLAVPKTYSSSHFRYWPGKPSDAIVGLHASNPNYRTPDTGLFEVPLGPHAVLLDPSQENSLGNCGVRAQPDGASVFPGCIDALAIVARLFRLWHRFRWHARSTRRSYRSCSDRRKIAAVTEEAVRFGGSPSGPRE